MESQSQRLFSILWMVTSSFILIFMFGKCDASRGGNAINRPNPHQCYVCLPDDKESLTSKSIISLFPDKIIPNCSSLNAPSHSNAHLEFQFNCPPNYAGCLLRFHGAEEARTCTPHKFHDCKIVNSMELCYCAHSLCNLNKKTIFFMKSQPSEPVRTSRHFDDTETDDEDLLENIHVNEEELGSGHEPQNSPNIPLNNNDILRNILITTEVTVPRNEEKTTENSTPVHHFTRNHHENHHENHDENHHEDIDLDHEDEKLSKEDEKINIKADEHEKIQESTYWSNNRANSGLNETPGLNGTTKKLSFSFGLLTCLTLTTHLLLSQIFTQTTSH